MASGSGLNHRLVGGQVVLTATFTTKVAGVDTPTDPTAVTFKVKIGDGTVASHGWPVPGTGIANPKVGTFTFTFNVDAPGRYKCRVEGTGACHAAADDTFEVDDTTVK